MSHDRSHQRCPPTPPPPKAKAKPAAGPATARFDASTFEMSKFEMPNVEMPAAFREFAEKAFPGQGQLGKMKAATEEATDMLEDSYATAARARPITASS